VSFPAALVYPLATDKQGVFCCVGGTSAAAPSWAGMVALMNQMHGQRAGFLNPRLYELGAAVPWSCLDEIWGIPLIPLRRVGHSPAGRGLIRRATSSCEIASDISRAV